LATELKESFEVEAELLSGERGDFEVVVNGENVFSKRIMSRFPEPGELTQLIRL
jgi:selT/selW/selH-like putative selenoprotein